MFSFFNSLFFTNRLFILLAVAVGLFFFSYPFPALLGIAKIFILLLLGFLFFDLLLIFQVNKGVFARRDTMEKLSNGDENPVEIYIENYYRLPIQLKVIDEAPIQFQLRDLQFETKIDAGKTGVIRYSLRPLERGEYHFIGLNIFTSSPLGLVSRKYTFSQNQMVAVYPSYIQMRKYELMAISNRLTEFGLKKIRRIGQSMEFEQIREYIKGDDYRTVNWKATARKGELMVNQFQDERSQQVYSLIDKGRVMRMPFNGLSLLDYAINAALVISNIAIKKDDKAGLISFAHKIDTVLKAQKMGGQMQRIQEVLYNQNTEFLETDFEPIYPLLRNKLNQRSLLILFTNFETLSGLKRQLPYLRRIAKIHLLVVVFFENTELKFLLNKDARKVKEVYEKTIGEKLAFEKRLIVKELAKYGIQTILTAPEDLTVNTINKYIELKARGMI